MKYLRIFCIVLIFCVLAGSVTPVFAQNYRFQVTDLAVVVTVNKDGSESLDYTMTFVNDGGAHVIDIVDIGMPNNDYDLNSITGEVNGVKITKITRSDVISPGISLYLGSNEIPAGGSGTVHANIGKVSNVLYPGTQVENQDYASLVFSPHYYDSANVHGTTNMQVTLLLPAGMTDQEPRYYTPTGGWPGPEQPESQIMADGRIFYTWVSNQANDYTQYSFGASFPAKYLNAGVIVTKPYEPPSSSSGGSSSGSTSFTSNFNLCGVVFCLGFIGFVALIIYSATVGAKKRKMEYLPPKISMEGHGIKRGLTAVEAAVLMQQPMDKIFTMILFGLLKKSAAEVVTKEPLELKISSPLPADLYGYETDFAAAFAEKDGPARKRLLQTVMINLIKSIGEKMKGFSQKETVAYYQDITERAWQQVEAAQTPDVKGQVYDENMDWTMLDKNYETRTQTSFGGPIFIPAPTWWWRFDPSFGSAASRTSSPTVLTGAGGASAVPSGGGSHPSISLPSLPGSAFAASVVNSVSSFSAGVLGDLTAFTGGVTRVTNPPPPPSTYRSGGGFGGGGGGHACACACACAGCACACAGGGR